MRRIRRAFETFMLGATVASASYACVAAFCVFRFGTRLAKQRNATTHPPISVLKPICGLEPQLESNLRSFCDQDYPSYQVIFGVSSARDPALPIVQVLAREFKDRIRIVIGDGSKAHRNPKVCTLAPMMAAASGEIFVIADSDMLVTRDYLHAIASCFSDKQIGAATALYRGEPADDSLASTLGAMWMTEHFAPAALVSEALQPLQHCFGATMAVRSNVWKEIGGVDAIGDHLADDHELGRLVSTHGHKVALARYIVTNVVSEQTLRHLINHELRWARTIRGVRPASYAGLVFTLPLPLAAASYLMTRRSYQRTIAVGIAVAARIALHACSKRYLQRKSVGSLWLVPIRDVLSAAMWAAGLAGSRVRWRDHVWTGPHRGREVRS